MQLTKLSSLILTLSISCISYASHAKDLKNSKFLNPTPEELTQKLSLHLDWRDTKISPAKDFYSYANGGWQQQNPIPPEYARWGIFSVLQEEVQNKLHNILRDASNNKNAIKGSAAQKVGDFYFSGMDEKSINQSGIKPLQPELDKIQNIKNKDDLQNAIAHLHSIGVSVPFAFTSMQDFKDSKNMIAVALQDGLGLPDKDYYLNEALSFQKIREEYTSHITRMLQLLGETAENAKAKAQKILKIETDFAKASMSKIDQRNPYAIYHIMNIESLGKLTPNFNWSKYFEHLNHPHIKEINLAMPHFFIEFNNKIENLSLEDWKTYLTWHLISTFAPYLSDDFVNEDFKLSQILSGTQKILPRFKRVINAENQALGFAVGKLYVDKYFPAQSKQAVLEIMQDIRKALNEDLQTLSWMTPETRTAALKKLRLMEERVGYPEKWRDYSKLKIDRGPYVLNVMRANKFLLNYELDKIGKPVDRTEWEMTPQTVNAYYHPTMNNINFPAGILLPPFFDPKAPPAVNYGGIGFIIGHEITHGFDDEGGQFDGYGNLKNWWTKEDYKKFQAATKCIVQQFSTYTVADNLAVQGKLVSGEATADLGGLILAYHAYHNSKHYKAAKTIEGVTPEQQFFLSAAHSWAGNIRPQEAKRLVLVDPHPPMKYRVNGTVANMPQFKDAYNIPNNSPMVNKNICVIW